MTQDHKTSIILCDGAVQARGKWSLIGVFTYIWARQFPANIGAFWMYVQLRDFRVSEQRVIRLEIVDNRADQDGNMRGEALWAVDIAIAQANPQETGNLLPFGVAIPVVRRRPDGAMEPVLFPEPGSYDVNIIVDGALYDVSSLEVRKVD